MRLKYVGVVEPHEGVGSAYNAGTIWEELEDGNFARLDEGGMRVERNTFLRFVGKGYLAPMYPCGNMEQDWLDKIKRCSEK